MTRTDIGPKVKIFFAQACKVPIDQITDDLVVGRALNTNEELAFNLSLTVHLDLFINSPDTTIKRLVENFEYVYDHLYDWEKKKLLEV